MPVRLSCPSCNTAFTLSELPADRRATCPRCGDLFPTRTYTTTSEAEAAPASIGSASMPADRAPRSWRRTTALILGVGFLGLGIGIAVYILRGETHPSPAPAAEATPPTSAVPAAQLTAIRYLPADTNLVLAVRPGPILAYAARTNATPRDFLRQAGIPAELFDGLANLGLSLPQIDHLVVATSLGDTTVVLRLTVVLVLHQPLADEAEFLHKLKAHQPPGKKYYEVELASLPLSLARVSPLVWVFGLDDRDLEAVERGGYEAGGHQLPPALAQSLENDIPPSAALWLAANDERWAEKPAVKLAVQARRIVKKEWLAVLARGKGGSAAVSFEEPPRLHVVLKADDAATGEQVRAYFQKLAAKSDTARVGGDGNLAIYDAPIDPSQVFATLTQFLDAAASATPPLAKP